MSKQFVTEWVIHTVQEQYAEDIALVVSHTTLRIEPEEPCISYFVPITKRGESFAQTFILEGIGYDIWGIPWERLEGFADLKEYNLTCLADAEILYARTDEDRRRFGALQKRLAENMADHQKMRIHALKAYEEAKQLYLELLFASGSDVRMGAGYVLDQLARAIAFSHHGYFKRAQTDQLTELQEITARSGIPAPIPDDFVRLYQEILLENEDATQKKKCYELLCLVRRYLTDIIPNAVPDIAPNTTSIQTPPERNYQDLADWYGELSYTWLRLKYYTQKQDSVKAYMWGIFLQSELNQICEDFGLEKIELMDAYDAKNLLNFAARAEEAERQIREIITKGGGQIHEYVSEDDFSKHLP